MNAGTCWDKNTIGRTAAVLKSPIKRPLPFFLSKIPYLLHQYETPSKADSLCNTEVRYHIHKPCHWLPSTDRLIQFLYIHLFNIPFILSFPPLLGTLSGLYFLGIPTKLVCTLSFPPRAVHSIQSRHIWYIFLIFNTEYRLWIHPYAICSNIPVHHLLPNITSQEKFHRNGF